MSGCRSCPRWANPSSSVRLPSGALLICGEYFHPRPVGRGCFLFLCVLSLGWRNSFSGGQRVHTTPFSVTPSLAAGKVACGSWCNHWLLDFRGVRCGAVCLVGTGYLPACDQALDTAAH